MNNVQQLGHIVFLCRLLEELYPLIMSIENDPSPTPLMLDLKQDLIKIARMIKEEIGEVAF